MFSVPSTSPASLALSLALALSSYLGVQTVLGRLRDKLQSGVAKAERAKVAKGNIQ